MSSVMMITSSSSSTRRRGSNAIIDPSFLYISSLLVSLVLLPTSESLPFIVLHGIGDQCENEGMTRFTKILANYSGQQGTCVEIGDGAKDSWLMPLPDQVEVVCEKVKSLSHLQDGYNIVGLSQGNLIGRGVIEWCDGGPLVHNMISLGGPHAGTASVPLCGSGFFCELADFLMAIGVYSSYVQDHLAPAGYIKIPMDLHAYFRGCKFLPKLNNELPESRNATYKERFSSLNHLVLIMFEKDYVLIPRETAWFGYYAPKNFKTINSPQETDLYKEDWIGLKTLDDAGKVTFLGFPGGHLEIAETEMLLYIVPYLVESSAKL